MTEILLLPNIEHEFRALCPYSIVVGCDGELAAKIHSSFVRLLT